jgi:hypothetical protein
VRNEKKCQKTYGPWCKDVWLGCVVLCCVLSRKFLHVIIIVKECRPDLYKNALFWVPKGRGKCDWCMYIKTCWILVLYVLYYKADIAL